MVVVVVGAGVAGLMAAGVARGQGHSVVVLEKMEKPGRKLRITGKGRCNITNTKSVDDFLTKVQSGGEFLRSALQEFDTGEVYRFFEKLGVPLIVERGDRVFPASGKAWDVALALVTWNERQGVEIRCLSQAQQVVVRDGRVCGIELVGGEVIEAHSVIITTGGVSYPSTGSTGDGHQMAYDLGHNIVPLRPSLVPLDVDSLVVKPVALRNVELHLLVDGARVDSRFGELEFTRDPGILGGAITLQLSRQAVDAVIDGRRVDLELDLKPALNGSKLRARILRELEALNQGSGATVKVLFQKLIPSELHAHVAMQSGLKLKSSVTTVSDIQVQELVKSLKVMSIRVVDYRPFSEAIVTAGGVDLEEVDATTLGSKLVKGLYFAGELLDVDADTGGYNIQIALSTGHLAGMLK